jgi:selenocysteine-specific elongation factor
MGERGALLFSNLPETANIDRTIIFSSGALTKTKYLLVKIKKIEQFKYDLKSQSKIHVSIGYETLMAECNFLKEIEKSDEFEQQDGLNSSGVSHALFELQHTVYVKGNDICLGAKLDSQKPTECRFAFYGKIIKNLESINEVKRFRRKEREGIIDRIESDTSIICVGLFKKETSWDIFNGMHVRIGENQELGKIENAFGKNGKVRIAVQNGLSECTKNSVKNGEKVKVVLKMKKFYGSVKIVDDV